MRPWGLWRGLGGRRDAAVSAVAEDLVLAGEQVCDGCAGYDDVVAVARPSCSDRDHGSAAGVDDDLGVDAAPVVFADRGGFLVVYRDQGAVDDPWPVIMGVGGLQHAREHR